MATNIATFTAVNDTCRDLMVGPGESATIIVTRTGSGDFSVAFQERIGTQYIPVLSITADTAGTNYANSSPAARYFRLSCAAIVGNDSIAVSLGDLAGESLPGYPITNSGGTTVFDVTDAGIETPLVTTTTVTATNLGGTLSTAAQPTVTSLGALTALTLNAAAGAASSYVADVKALAAITDAAATTLLTITVPNSAQAAVIKATVVGSLGAGGAIGAYEASATNSYNIVVSRTAGVNAVAEISAAYGVDASAVAGATTVTATLALAAVVGAVGASNSFPVQVTITKGGGASAAHTALVHYEVLNAVGSGVTVA